MIITIEHLRAMLTHCALAVLVANEFSASRCTGHENVVLEDHEI